MEIADLVTQTLKNALSLDVVVGALIFCVFIFLVIKLSNHSSVYSYRQIPLFSEAEHAFFLVLLQSIPDDCDLFAKVRIADVLAPEKRLSRKNWNKAFYRISSKHFDYVLCDRESLSVVAVIELDDRSHNQSKVRKRDAFVEKACESANLKLLRFQCKRNYQVDSIRDTISKALK